MKKKILGKLNIYIKKNQIGYFSYIMHNNKNQINRGLNA